METLRIKRDDIYTIEVNDKGETIQFAMGDIELPFKCERAFGEVRRIEKDLQAQIVIISKKQDHPQEGKVMTANEEAIITAYNKAYKEMRNAMDVFLGEGACQKIFGNDNYHHMFHDLFEALEPHLDKMALTAQGVMDRIKAKYGKKDDGVLR